MAFGNGAVLTVGGRNIKANRIKGAGTEPVYLAVGIGAETAARTALAANTVLSNERTTTRPAGISSVVTDTYKVVATVTCTGAAWSLDEAALFDAATGGTMYCSITFTSKINLDVNDTVTLTISDQQV